MQTNRPADPVLRRDPAQAYPIAVGGQGATIETAEGQRFLDGTSCVFVNCLGIAPEGIADAIHRQMSAVQFAYSGEFATEAGDRMARLLLDRSPKGMAKVSLCTSGAAANEGAVKLARAYHLSRGRAEKTVVISRWHSYHGSTLGALSLTGSMPRRRPYHPYMIPNVAHVSPPNPYRFPGGDPNAADTAAADEIEATIRRLGAQYVSAVLVEPVAGAPLGALVSSANYLARVRDICDRYDVLMICDEVVSGMGRTGTWFALEPTGVVPDIITLAKSLAAGFLPIGAVIAHERVAATTAGRFVHGESYTGHPGMAAAACATIDYIETRGLLSRVRDLSARLFANLEHLSGSALVGEVRGRGLLAGLELVADRETRAPFPRARMVAERVVKAARERGVLLLAGTAGADGEDGDTVVMAPPFVTTDAELDRITDTLSDALDAVAADLLD